MASFQAIRVPGMRDSYRVTEMETGIIVSDIMPYLDASYAASLLKRASDLVNAYDHESVTRSA